jgi:hypothetical protein
MFKFKTSTSEDLHNLIKEYDLYFNEFWKQIPKNKVFA